MAFLLAFATPKRLRESEPLEHIENSDKDYVLNDIVDNVEAVTLELLNDILNDEELTEDEEELIEELELDIEDEAEIEEAIEEIEEDEGEIVEAISELSGEILFDEINEHLYEEDIASEEEVELEEEEEVSIINDIAEEAIDIAAEELPDEESEILSEEIIGSCLPSS